MLYLGKLPFILHYIKEKQAQGHSLLILIAGETGNGKSMAGLWLGHFFYKAFDVYKNLFFDVDKFLIHLSVAEKEAIIIDEGDKHLNYTEWWDSFNKAFHIAVSTQRYKNNLYIVILPLVKHLATQHRDMADVLFVMANPGVCLCYIIKKKFGEFRDIQLKPRFVGILRLPMPKEGLVKDYKIREKIDKENIIRDAISKSCPKRYCLCGKKVEFLESPCPYCGFMVHIDIKELDQKINNRNRYAV